MPRGKKKEPKDEFVDWTIHLYQFIRTHLNKITWAAAICIVVFLALFAGVKMSQYKDEKAAVLLYEARKQTGDARIQALEKVANSYSRTSSGQIAMLVLGGELIKAQKYGDAAGLFEKLASKSKKPLMRVAALHKLGETQSAMGDNEKAIKTYIEASNVSGNLNKDESLYEAALIYEKLNDYAKAADIYKKIMDTGTSTVAKSLSEERLLWLVADGSVRL